MHRACCHREGMSDKLAATSWDMSRLAARRRGNLEVLLLRASFSPSRTSTAVPVLARALSTTSTFPEVFAAFATFTAATTLAAPFSAALATTTTTTTASPPVSTIIVSSPTSGQVSELLGHLLACPLHDLHQVSCFACILSCYEGHREPFRPSTACPSNAVHVVLGVIWRVVVDNQGHTLHVQASGSHIRGDDDLRLAVAEVHQSLLSLLLVLVAMDGVAVHLRPVQAVLQLLAHPLRGAEDHGSVLASSAFRDVVLQEEFCKFTNLAIRVNHPHHLGDIG
mmetsp:Transcript_33555/g.72652  ORF Transcript_33555/g.72652 Transcript_33555/m.72652 type:complete len:281 (-) Transcript_33555:1193-2035(-)